MAGLNVPRENLSLQQDFEWAVQIDRKVPIVLADGSREIVDLAHRVKTNQPFRVELDLSPYGETKGKSLSVWVAYTNLTCYADGKKIYEFHAPKDSLVKSGSYSLHMIDLPKQIDEKIITLVYEPLFKNIDSYKVSSFAYGKRLNIFFTHIFKKELLTIIFLMMLFFVFLLTVSITIVNRIKKNYGNKILYRGLICFFVGCYFATQLWTINYLLHDYSTLIYFIEYFSFMLMILPVFGMLKGGLDPKYDRMINFGINLTIANFLIQCSLFIFRNIEFRQMLFVTQLIIIVDVLISIGMIILTKSQNYPQKKFLLNSLFPLWLNLILAIGSYLIYGRMRYRSFILLGVVVFVGIQVYYIIQNYTTVENEKMKSAIYREMAYIDAMTGLQNRRAYSEKKKKLEVSKEPCWILSLDLNYLKNINDTHGHQAGDDLIVTFSEMLQEVFYRLDCRDVFRTGGDEFNVFFSAPEDFDMKKLIDQLKQKGRAFAKVHPPMPIEFAVGYYFYSGDPKEILKEVARKADHQMYENKAELKRQKISSQSGESKDEISLETDLR